MNLRLDTTQKDFSARFKEFLERKSHVDSEISRQVARIIRRVRLEGDVALREYSKVFDHFELPCNEGFAIPDDAITTAFEMCETETIDALKISAQRIEIFHRKQLPEDVLFVDNIGVELGYRWKPLQSVGLYVPGGTASYPSSVLMNAIPARIAGVKRITIVTPTPHGAIQPLVLAAARIAGVNEIYRLGGAHAIAALAFGCESVARVDKIIGPGNAYVAEAKRQIFGICGIDAIAGPSEITVLAEGGSNTEWIAADMLSQAEHDASSRVALVTDDATLGDDVASAIEAQLENLPRKNIAQQSWRNFGAIILVKSMEEGSDIVNQLAPEHLEIFSTNAKQIAEHVYNAGAIFLGSHTPETVGDYVGGPNHVLPTNGSARFTSGLSTLDFFKRTTLLCCPPDALEKLAPAAITLAQAEGLDAHAKAVKFRTNKS